MRLGRATSLISAVHLLLAPCQCFPVDGHLPPQSQGLAPRATYSVVPIDGGSGPGGSGNSGGPGGSGSGSGSDSGNGSGKPPTETVTVTVVETLTPKTSFRTVYITPAPATHHITDTVVVTKTVQIVVAPPSSSSGSATSTSEPTSTATRTTSSSFTSLAPSMSTFYPVSLTSSSTSSVTIPPSLPPPSVTVPLQTGFSSSTTTHDDGKWHTSYPPWNGTLLRRGSRNGPRPRRIV